MPDSEFPFRTRVALPEAAPLSDLAAGSASDEEWSEHDLEAAYRQTLEAVDAATEEMSWAIETADPSDAPHESPESDHPEPAAPGSADSDPDGGASPAEITRITARQVVEALLFVGGGPVTGKQIAELLGGDATHESVDDLVESLNALYVEQSRPYEVRLVKGGYQLTLRPEYDRVRDRVFGLGPREVRLSQDALELLALVAYQQPISKTALDELGKSNASTVLRQLLRRQLISLERDDDDDKTVIYHTTDRFLELFGLTSLDDLPQVEDLMLR